MEIIFISFAIGLIFGLVSELYKSKNKPENDKKDGGDNNRATD